LFVWLFFSGEMNVGHILPDALCRKTAAPSFPSWLGAVKPSFRQPRFSMAVYWEVKKNNVCNFIVMQAKCYMIHSIDQDQCKKASMPLPKTEKENQKTTQAENEIESTDGWWMVLGTKKKHICNGTREEVGRARGLESLYVREYRKQGKAESKITGETMSRFISTC
jgi:hypothetical protein